MIKRWPGHPTPISCESLSSWLRRIGMVYGLSIHDLLRWGLGFQGLQTSWLDRSPPDQLVTAISARTGVMLETVYKATLAGRLPFLFDYSECEDTRSTSTSSIRHLRSGLSAGIPWFRKPQRGQVTACRLCFEKYPDAGFLLPWRLAILLSCPIHGLMLESAHVTANSVSWLNDSPEQAPDVVRRLDSRTWAAVTEGSVKLPGGVFDTAEWFRLLRIIHRQLKKPMDRFGRRVEWQQIVCEHSPKILFQKRTQSDPARRWAIVLATALDLMEKGHMELIGPGDFLLSMSMMRDPVYGGQRLSRVQREVMRWTSR